MVVGQVKRWNDFFVKEFAPSQFMAVASWEPATAVGNRFEGVMTMRIPGPFRFERVEWEHQHEADTGDRADEDRDTCVRLSYYPQTLQMREVVAEMAEFRRDIDVEDWVDFRSMFHVGEFGEEYDGGRMEAYAAHTVTGIPIICRITFQGLGSWVM